MSAIMEINSTSIKVIQTRICDFSQVLKSYCHGLEKRLKNKQIKKDFHDLKDTFKMTVK